MDSGSTCQYYCFKKIFGVPLSHLHFYYYCNILLTLIESTVQQQYDCTSLLVIGFEPTTLLLVSSYQGITFLTWICMYLITLPLLVASPLGDLAEVTKTTTVVTGKVTHPLKCRSSSSAIVNKFIFAKSWKYLEKQCSLIKLCRKGSPECVSFSRKKHLFVTHCGQKLQKYSSLLPQTLKSPHWSSSKLV